MVDMEEIKKAVSKKPIFESLASEPLPHEVVDLEKMIKEAPSVAPVFIKMDKYKEILQKINDLRSSMNKIEDILRVRKNMHEINLKSDEMLEKNFQEFAEATNHFKREFVVARNIPFYPEDEDKKETDKDFSKLSGEISKLKKDLENLDI
jgi:hypothetical protein